MGCCRTLLKTSSKTVNLFKITKYVNGTQHSGDHGNSDLERKRPTGTRQFGGIKASLAQAEIVEAVKLQYKYFAKFVKQNCIGTYFSILEKILLQA